jgi:hypothetical protein
MRIHRLLNAPRLTQTLSPRKIPPNASSKTIRRELRDE